MSKILKVGGQRRQPPIPDGLHQAVLTHVTDVGEQTNKFYGKTSKEPKTKPQYILTWQLDCQYKNADGAVCNMVHDAWYHATLHPDSNLYKATCDMLGVAKLQDEYDVDELIGKRCMLKMKRKIDKDTYSDIIDITPVIAQLEPMAVQDIPLLPWITALLSPKTSSDAAVR